MCDGGFVHNATNNILIYTMFNIDVEVVTVDTGRVYLVK